MKQALIAVFLLSFTASAQAAIKGLPKELKGVLEARIQEDALEEIGYELNCQIEQNIPGKFAIVKRELQDEEFAEYKGELSKFTLEATLELPAECKKSGKVTCTLDYNLYDERAYQPDAQTVSCN